MSLSQLFLNVAVGDHGFLHALAFPDGNVVIDTRSDTMDHHSALVSQDATLLATELYRLSEELSLSTDQTVSQRARAFGEAYNLAHAVYKHLYKSGTRLYARRPSLIAVLSMPCFDLLVHAGQYQMPNNVFRYASVPRVTSDNLVADTIAFVVDADPLGDLYARFLTNLKWMFKNGYKNVPVFRWRLPTTAPEGGFSSFIGGLLPPVGDDDWIPRPRGITPIIYSQDEPELTVYEEPSDAEWFAKLVEAFGYAEVLLSDGYDERDAVPTKPGRARRVLLAEDFEGSYLQMLGMLSYDDPIINAEPEFDNRFVVSHIVTGVRRNMDVLPETLAEITNDLAHGESDQITLANQWMEILLIAMAAAPDSDARFAKFAASLPLRARFDSAWITSAIQNPIFFDNELGPDVELVDNLYRGVRDVFQFNIAKNYMRAIVRGDEFMASALDVIGTRPLDEDVHLALFQFLASRESPTTPNRELYDRYWTDAAKIALTRLVHDVPTGAPLSVGAAVQRMFHPRRW